MSREYTYYNESLKKTGRGRRARRYTVFDLAMLILTVAVALSVMISWAARWMNPASYGALSAAGLLMPALFFANFLLLLYWIIRWKKAAYLPLAIFIPGIWFVTLFFRPQLTQDHTDLSGDRSLFTVMTYNVRGMMEEVNHEAGTFVSSMDKVISAIDSQNPGILCVQEFQSTMDYPHRRFDDRLPQLRFRNVRYNIGTDDGPGWGLAVYSKFPIVDSGHMNFEGTSNSVMWADIAVNRDTVRVFNAHLQTTSISATDQEYIVNMGFVKDSVRTVKMKNLLGRLRNNYVIRASQADALARKIAASPYPVIVCGDFNDTPVSYVYRRINKGLRDSFREAGNGYGYTYRGFFNLLRIDYIMHSKLLECVEYDSPPFECSDHNPVVVKFRMNKIR